MEWQPIETVPLQEDVLLYDNEGNVRAGIVFSRYSATKPRAFKSDLDFGDFSASSYWPDDLTATHWMPLPEPPQ